MRLGECGNELRSLSAFALAFDAGPKSRRASEDEDIELT